MSQIREIDFSVLHDIAVKHEVTARKAYEIYQDIHSQCVKTINQIDMKDPQEITVIVPKATYEVPLFRVTNDGFQDAGTFLLTFCKGNKADETALRQLGFFTETLIAAAKKYLEENNVGDLATLETYDAIGHLATALELLGKRAADRQARQVQGTYEK